MSIQIRYFASLRETLGRGEDQLDASQANTVTEAWNIATQGADMPANLLCAVNMEYVDTDHAITDGDEVAFFPPVTGG